MYKITNAKSFVHAIKLLGNFCEVLIVRAHDNMFYASVLNGTNTHYLEMEFEVQTINNQNENEVFFALPCKPFIQATKSITTLKDVLLIEIDSLSNSLKVSIESKSDSTSIPYINKSKEQYWKSVWSAAEPYELAAKKEMKYDVLATTIRKHEGPALNITVSKDILKIGESCFSIDNPKKMNQIQSFIPNNICKCLKPSICTNVEINMFQEAPMLLHYKISKKSKLSIYICHLK